MSSQIHPSIARPIPSWVGKVEQQILNKYYFQQYAPSTLESYKSDWKIFGLWCQKKGIPQLPAEPVNIATFLCSQAEAGLKASTISRRRVAIRYYHALAGIDPYPTDDEMVKAVMRGIRRTLSLQKEQKEPITADRLMKILNF